MRRGLADGEIDLLMPQQRLETLQRQASLQSHAIAHFKTDPEQDDVFGETDASALGMTGKKPGQ